MAFGNSNRIRPRSVRRSLSLAACAAFFTPVLLTQPPGPSSFDTPESREQGRSLFQTHCAYCHGARGEGGRGVDLTTGVYRHGGSDAELYATIRNGIPGTEMPTVRATNDEVWKMVSFVKSIGAGGVVESAPGDRVAGKAVYDGKGKCAACHSIGAEGGILGPNLAGVGRRRNLAYLRESLVTPEADVPVLYRAIQVMPKTGPPVRGIRLNEDDLSIQLRDSQNNLRSFFKEELKEIRRDKPSLMPAYGDVLNAQELENLVAYLSSLRETL